MSDFLTVKEAARITGKSPSSIRRIVYPIIENDQHPDRHHVHPPAEEVQQLRMRGETFAWRLSEELLRREIPKFDSTTKTTDNSRGEPGSKAQDELLAMLRRELDIKNQQIAQQLELIHGLSERLHEGNVLFGSLQQQLALPDSTKRAKAHEVDQVERVPSAEPKKQGKKQPKRGWFGRVFRSA